jgi:circadian clock protein KaiB
MADKKREGKTPATKRFKEAVAAGTGKYVLKLYITGMTPRSQQAVRNIKKIIKDNPDNNFELEVIDIYQKPSLAKGDQIIAVPTLIKKLPSPLRRLIGDLSQEDRIILGLDLKPKSPPANAEQKES